MHALVERCAKWNSILTVGLDKLSEAIDVASNDNFHVDAINGARVVGLWSNATRATFNGNVKAVVDGQDSFVAIGEKTKLFNTQIRISGKRSYVIIGPNCRLRKVELQIKGDDCLIVIGAGTTWETGAAICDAAQSIVIGDDCMFSSGVILRVSDGHSIWSAGGEKRISVPKDVVIHPHVWLGNSSRVSKGAIVGMGTTIGQMSLVTGRLGPHSIYGGVPAKLIRSNSEWSRTDRYEDIPQQYRFSSMD